MMLRLSCTIHSHLVWHVLTAYLIYIYDCIESCRSTDEKDEAITKRNGEIERLNDLLRIKGDDIKTKDDKIKELEEEIKVAKVELKEAKVELKEAKEDAKNNAEEAKELPVTLKAKDDWIQELEHRSDKCVSVFDSFSSAMHEAMHVSKYVCVLINLIYSGNL